MTLAKIGWFARQAFTRTGLHQLPARLKQHYGIEVAELDVGVYRVARADGPDRVTRVFPAARPPAVCRRSRCPGSEGLGRRRFPRRTLFDQVAGLGPARPTAAGYGRPRFGGQGGAGPSGRHLAGAGDRLPRPPGV